MAHLEILTYPDPRLREKAAAVTSFDDELRTLIGDMVETMYLAPGVGLAATQVGALKRVLVIDISVGDEQDKLLECVNPEIFNSEGEEESVEGCLSVPEYNATIKRAAKVWLRAFDRFGIAYEREFEGLEARALQHEVEHLDGILFIDHLSSLKRDLAKRKLRKLKRDEQTKPAGKRAATADIL